MDDVSPDGMGSALSGDVTFQVVEAAEEVFERVGEMVAEVAEQLSAVVDDVLADCGFADNGSTPRDDHFVDLSGIDVDGDGVSGNPTAWALNWFYQEHDGYCGPSAAAQIVAQYTGLRIDDPDQLMDRALDLGLMAHDDPSQGMTLGNLEILLEDQGIPSTLTTSSLDDLACRLEEGHGVIAMVDSGEIWGTDTTDSDGEPDHVLVVAGIDQERGMVVLSDPGDPGGSQLQIPVGQFEDAWRDSGNALLVADAPDPALAPASQSAASSDSHVPWSIADLRRIPS